MTDAELDEVEAALGRPLPADYRRFVRACPIPDWSRYCRYLYTSSKEMIRQNRDQPRRAPDSDVREPDGAGGVRERPWPTDWTVIGDADSEWYTFVRPDAPGVWEWRHDTREVARAAASFDEYLERQRERIGPPPVLEVTRHPILGGPSWDPERRAWEVNVAGVGVVLKPGTEDRDAFLADTAGLVPAAVSAEPRVFADAMAAGGWAEFLEWADGVAHGLAADTVRGRLVWESLEVTPGPTIEYHYRTASEVGRDFLWAFVEADGLLAVTGQGWYR